MAYGLTVYDENAFKTVITPNITSLYGGGREAMPTSGTSGQTYEKAVALDDDYSEASIGVLADSFVMNIDVTLYNLTVDSKFYIQSWFLNNSSSFFTRTESTGVITTFTPNKSAPTAYDGLLAVYPIAFWDKRGAASFNTINIFAGTSYLAYDLSAGGYKTVYTLGTQGVENVDYVVFLKNYKGE